MIKRLLLCSTLIVPVTAFAETLEVAGEELIYQNVDEIRDKPKITFITDRGNSNDFPYVLGVVDKMSGDIYKVFARPDYLAEESSSDGKGVWLSEKLKRFAYTYSPQEKKIVDYRRQRDPKFKKWFNTKTQKILDLCGFSCNLEWLDTQVLLGEIEMQGGVEDALTDASPLTLGGLAEIAQSKPDRILSSTEATFVVEKAGKYEFKFDNINKADKRPLFNGARVTVFIGDYKLFSGKDWDGRVEGGYDLNSGAHLIKVNHHEKVEEANSRFALRYREFGIEESWDDEPKPPTNPEPTPAPEPKQEVEEVVEEEVVTEPTQPTGYNPDFTNTDDLFGGDFAEDDSGLGDFEKRKLMRSRGFLITAFATPASENFPIQEGDISKGFQTSYGVISQWNEVKGRVPAMSPTKLAEFPHRAEIFYGTMADAYIEIDRTGTYEFRVVGPVVGSGGLLFDGTNVAVLIDDQLIFSGTSWDGVATDGYLMEEGEHKIKVYYHQQDIRMTASGEIAKYRLMYRRVEDEGGWKELSDVLTSERAAVQPDYRSSKPTSEISVESFIGYTRTNEAIRQQMDYENQSPVFGLGLFDKTGYSTETKFSQSTNGRYLGPRRTLHKYSFDYDARRAGSYFVLPKIQRITDDVYGNNQARCVYSINVYDEDTSSYRSVYKPIPTQNALRNSTLLTDKRWVYGSRGTDAEVGEDYADRNITKREFSYTESLGHIIVDSPKILHFQGEIICEDDFALSFLFNAPNDVVFRAHYEK